MSFLCSPSLGLSQLDRDATFCERDQVWRWTSNGAPVPLTFFRENGLAEPAGQDRAYQAHLEAAIAEYRANYTGPSDEERAEARAAHGPGVRLTDVITGHRWTT